jgi:hypothetical protein
MNINNPKFCPVCGPALNKDSGEEYNISCDKCGRYKITMEGYDDYLSKSNWHLKNSHKIIHYLNKFSYFGAIKTKEVPVLDPVKLLQISQESLPTIAQQYENLILFIGNELSRGIAANGANSIVFIQQFDLPYTCYAIGSDNKTMFNSIAEKLRRNGVITDPPGIKLSFDGWMIYDELKNNFKRKGYDAFMAMKFGDQELDGIYEKHFKPSIKQTNFNLKRIDEEPEAGIIDLRLRNKIKNCRFLIADLTHENNGAYWEAGYAEGLGKPVIYTCRADQKGKTHFDTNHSLTVFWDINNITKATEELKSVIRYTIPESKQED